jgi:TnsA-like endonuclease N terminal
MSRGQSATPLMALDADPGVEAVASQPMWLHWVSDSGKPRRYAPDFFARRADGTGMLIDVRPDDRITAADDAVFAATAAMAGQAGWAYHRAGELPAVRAANLRWLAGYRHPRYARPVVMAALAEVFAEPGPLRAGAAEVGDPVAVLPVLFAMLWRGGLAADLDAQVLDSASTVWAAGGRAG